MSDTTHRQESTAAALYVALELSAKEWMLTMSTGPAGRRQRARLQPGDRAGFERAIATAKLRLGVAGSAPVRSCYEAGRDGFWPHRFLTVRGVSNLVVDSSSIEVPRRVRRAKTDRLDGEKLLRLLLRHWGGERGMWQVVHVPSREVEDARHASRGLTTLQAERTRYRNRIRGLLALHGVMQVRHRRAAGGALADGDRLGGSAAAGRCHRACPRDASPAAGGRDRVPAGASAGTPTRARA